MNSFRGTRVVHEFTQTNPAAPSQVFSLLCPVREEEWLPGWQYRLIYSESGVAELGCVFTTPNASAQAERTWIVTEYDRARYRIGFVWLDPGRVITDLGIQLEEADARVTHSKIRYRYTGLSEDGNREVESYDRKWFEGRMKNWERCINHFLRTGKKVEV